MEENVNTETEVHGVPSALSAELGAWNNGKVMIVRNKDGTQMWLADTPGVFKGHPTCIWSHGLPDTQCESLLADPFQLWERPAPNG